MINSRFDQTLYIICTMSAHVFLKHLMCGARKSIHDSP